MERKAAQHENRSSSDCCSLTTERSAQHHGGSKDRAIGDYCCETRWWSLEDVTLQGRVSLADSLSTAGVSTAKNAGLEQSG
jgi:hypothetical protein